MKTKFIRSDEVAHTRGEQGQCTAGRVSHQICPPAFPPAPELVLRLDDDKERLPSSLG